MSTNDMTYIWDGFSSSTWWLVLIRGILGLVFGWYALTHPQMMIMVLVLALGVYFLIDGIMLVADTLATPGFGGIKWLVLLSGVLCIWLGLVIFVRPLISAINIEILLVYFIGIVALISGVGNCIKGLRRRGKGNRWLPILNGTISILFGILLLWNSPFISAGILMQVAGIFSIISGLALIPWAILLYRMSRTLA